MWRRAFTHLVSVVGIVLMAAWLVASIALTVWIGRTTGIELRRKGAVGAWMLIFLTPIGIYVAIDEFVVRPWRYGPPEPGRRKRGAIDSAELRLLDDRLRKPGGGA